MTDKEPDLKWDSSDYEDADEEMWAHAHLVDELTVFMKAVNPEGQWHAVVNNFGWRHQDGAKYFDAHNGLDLLHEVLPKTECTYKIWLRMEENNHQITIDNAHHDAPTGGEMYYITPMLQGEEDDGDTVAE